MRLAVAMSGGVDSSVVAKMMVDKGFEVVGLFLKLWSSPDCGIKRDNRCCDLEALEDARAVANKLGIPFYVINAEKEFKKEVVDYFLEEYKNLRTPNPCIVCNDKIKFDLLLKKALQLGCEKLATGHYARIEDPGNPKIQDTITKQIPNQKSQNQNKTVIPAKAGIQELRTSGSRIKSGMTGGDYRLFTGVDELKDQSYMLYRLSQDQLSKILFPLGETTKKEVRELAKKWDLPVKEKPESQEICFVAEKDYREFLRRYLPAKSFQPGDIVNQKGEVVGRHEGLVNYTVGQRKGIEQQKPTPLRQGFEGQEVLSPKSKENSKSKILNEDRTPLYVVGFEVEKNQLIVGEDMETYKKEMVVGNLSRIQNTSGVGFDSREVGNLKVKIRYRHPAVKINQISNIKNQNYRSKAIKLGNLRANQKDIKNVILSETKNPVKVAGSFAPGLAQDDVLKVRFENPQRAVTPGQSAVFYCGDQVLGGGVIVE